MVVTAGEQQRLFQRYAAGQELAQRAMFIDAHPPPSLEAQLLPAGDPHNGAVKLIELGHGQDRRSLSQPGEVDAGFVYATDVAVQKDKVKVVVTVPTDTPVTYPIAAIASGPQQAGGRQFIAFVLAPAGQAILGKYGFGRP